MTDVLQHFEYLDLNRRLFDTALCIVLFLVVRFLLIRIVLRFRHDQQATYVWRKGAAYFSEFLLILLLALTWIRDFRSVGTYLGLLSAGLAVALKDPLANFAGWLFILARKPFEVGDRIQIGDHAGDVVDIDLFQFTLMESGISGSTKFVRTGRLVKISNSVVFTEALVNFSKGWFEYSSCTVELSVTFESNWKKAKALLHEIVIAEGKEAGAKAAEELDKASSRYMVLEADLQPHIFTEVGGNGVVLTAWYLCHPRHQRTSTTRVWEQILDKFAEEKDIAFAYSTQRSFNNVTEGKTGPGTAN